jgi:hypothetical protein
MVKQSITTADVMRRALYFCMVAVPLQNAFQTPSFTPTSTPVMASPMYYWVTPTAAKRAPNSYRTASTQKIFEAKRFMHPIKNARYLHHSFPANLDTCHD